MSGVICVHGLLCSTHGRTTSGVKCHHCPWKAYAIGRRWAWHVIIALGHKTRLDHSGRRMPAWIQGSTHGRTTSSVAFLHFIIALRQHTLSDDVERDWQLYLFDNTQEWTTLCLTCHHRPWTTPMVVRRWALHVIIAL